MSTSYPEPVAKLLTWGEPEGTSHEKWPNYLEQTGIELAHVPDLLRLIGDKELHTTDSDEEDPKYWGPVHAWRTLGQLKASEAVKPLLDLVPELLDDNTGFGEWVIEELPQVYGLIGKDALPLLERYLADPAYNEEARINTGDGLEWVARMHPEAREDAVKILTHQLEAYEDNPPDINGFLILHLAKLKVQEALPLIERAFASGNVDEIITDLDDVLAELGLKERPSMSELSSLFSSLASKEDSASLRPSPFASLADRLSAHTATPSEKYFNSPTASTKPTKKAKQKMTKASKKKNRRK